MSAFVSLLLLAVETVAQLAVNPVLGLNEDGVRISALLGVVSKIGMRGPAAMPELEAFTNEIKALVASGQRVDLDVWDALSKQRHSDAEAIAEAVREP